MYTARLPQINPERPISKYRTYYIKAAKKEDYYNSTLCSFCPDLLTFFCDPKWNVLKIIIARNTPPRAPNAKMPAFSILNARIDPAIPTKTLTISAVQFNPVDEFYGITASHMI